MYELSHDYLARRGAFRDAHLQLAWQAARRGDLLLGGALADPVDETVLLFTGDGPETAQAFARADPYVCHGLVLSWRVRSWATVVGELAAAPVRPEADA